jgi:hypothetical protein
MPLAGPAWLDDGDKISSIISAVIGIVALLVSLYQARHTSRPAEQSIPPRRWRLVVAGMCAAIATAGAISVAWAPRGLRLASVVVGGAAGAIALAMIITGIVARLRDQKRLDPAVRRLLEAHLSEADFHQYEFGSLPLPGVSLIYVEQHLGAVGSGRPATRILDADMFVRSSPRAIVIGAPGAGKSTLAAHVVGSAARWWTHARVVSRINSSPFGRLMPVLLPANALSDKDVPHALATRWSQADASAEMFTRPPHRNVEWLVIVDSLDEISAGETRTRVIQRLGAFLSSETRSHLIVTTRALTVGELADLTSRGAQEFYLRLFGPQELQHFATNWFNARGGGLVDAATEATRFMGHVRSAGLTSIVRVPLLATMAILVYENDRDRTLPTSRAGLYHEFTCLLRSARTMDASTPFEVWLANNLDSLLRALASEHVREDSLRLLPWAIGWVAANAPAELLTGSEAERIGALRNALIASGLCVFVPSLDADAEEPDPSADRGSARPGNDVEFVHFTLAEYLAADPLTCAYSYEEFRSLMANGRSRGFALFVLARGKADPSDVVRSLLDSDDPLSAGRIVSDGIPVDADLRQRAIDALIERVRHDHETVVDCVALLADLANAPDVWLRLQDLVEDTNQTWWARAVVADALYDLEVGGDHLLQNLVQQVRASDSEAIWWARQRLAARAGSAPGSDDMTVRYAPSARSLGEIGRRSCIATATDERQSAAIRIHASRILYAAGDETGSRVLHALAGESTVDPNLRLQAAQTLTAGGDRRGPQALASLALVDRNAMTRIPIDIRRAATDELLSQGDPVGTESLRQLARDFELSRPERRQVVEQLVARDDPFGREMLTQLNRQQTRRDLQVRLCGAALAIGGLVIVASRGLVTRQALPLIGAACVVVAAILLTASSAWLPQIPRRRTLRHRPMRPPGSSGDRTPRGAKHLASAVFTHMDDFRRAAGDATIQVHLTRQRQLNTLPTEVDQTELAQWLGRSPERTVVIIGAPGSGKTHVATSLVLDLIQRRGTGPVPVLLSMRNWSASNRSLEDWMIDRLASDYEMSTEDIADLFAAKQIMPVLDGLDEITYDLQRRATQEISAMTRRRVACVVTCRTGEYRRLAEEGAFLDQAAIFEMLPLRSRDVVEFIIKNVPEDQRKAWTPVIRELEQEFAGPFADLMSSPLTATIALRPYLATGRNPLRLLRLAHSRGGQLAAAPGLFLGDYLVEYLDDSLSNIDRYGPRKSAQWLGTIARQTERDGAGGFNWRSVQDLPEAPTMRVAAAVIAVPPAIAVIVALSTNALKPSVIAAAGAVVLGLFVMSARFAGRSRANFRPLGSSGTATAVAAMLASILATGAGLLGYTGTGQLGSSLILAIAGASSFWTTEAGRFHISRTYFALTGRLPWSIRRFLDTVTRAGIMRFDGTSYRFAHVLMQEYFAQRR